MKVPNSFLNKCATVSGCDIFTFLFGVEMSDMVIGMDNIKPDVLVRLILKT